MEAVFVILRYPQIVIHYMGKMDHPKYRYMLYKTNVTTLIQYDNEKLCYVSYILIHCLYLHNTHLYIINENNFSNSI